MFTGQITGCEGYVESASVGLLTGYFAALLCNGQTPLLPPRTTALGAVLAHLSDATDIEHYQPMNVNFGLFPDLPPELTLKGKYRYLKGAERKEGYCRRALQDILPWIEKIKA